MSDQWAFGIRFKGFEHLSGELTAIDAELDTQHELCLEMQTTVEKMRARLCAMRHGSVSTPPSDDPGSNPQPSG